LAGHERYLKTTLYGLTSGAPSCVILMVGANAGLIGMSKEHLAIALALSVPVVVCITKVSSFILFQNLHLTRSGAID
jgi:GTPase